MKTIATLGSHCALQLLSAAKSEGFSTLLITRRERERFYRRFRFIDHFVTVERFSDITQKRIQDQLLEHDTILIPHGTFISEVGVNVVENHVKLPIFGNRWILRWEADRVLKEKLLLEAGLRVPKSFSSDEEIDRLVIVKLPGAEGGRGYFLASDSKSFHKGLETAAKTGLVKPGEEADLYIQEYVVGVPVYLQYFHSIIADEVELMGVDRRYETNVDAFGRIPAESQIEARIHPTYMVVGNIPLVLRESLLGEVYAAGDAFVKASKKLVPPGMLGPFCIEGVYDENAKLFAFEFSGRIVAGTNLYVDGSPYTSLYHGEKMSMGRRIALEIKRALEAESLSNVLT